MGCTSSAGLCQCVFTERMGCKYSHAGIDPCVDVILAPFHSISMEIIRVIFAFQVSHTARAVESVEDGIWSPVKSASNLGSMLEPNLI